ncbi:hypothetical protein BASA82_000055 [Batrachochytrium salamandrivorans]|nr:hypothetical protein BASA82_000055 [Batrachochytrium salamandrivorans]
MKSFNELGTIGVVNEVVQLFQGKDALLAQFALFLPQGHQILNQSSLHATASSSPPPSCSEEPSTAATSTATSGTSEYVLVIPTAVAEEDELPPSIMSPKPSGMDQALEFVRRVKERFSQRDSETTSFQSFLDMLNSIQTQPKSFIEISAMREIEEIIAGASGHSLSRRSVDTPPPSKHPRLRLASASNSNLCLPSTAGLAIPSAMMTTSTFNTLLAPLPSNLALARAPAPPRALSLPLLRMDEFIFHRIKTFFSQSKQGQMERVPSLPAHGREWIITRFELITLGRIGSPPHRSFGRSLIDFLQLRGFTDDAQEDAWFSVPMTDVDFDGTAEGEQELHFGGRNVSYHFLPKDYPPVSSANASPLLNSQLIAVPNHLNPNYTPVAVTTTASATMVSLVRNACEEKLFKCEDDQYEMSLLVDCNQSTIQLLELAMEEGEVSFPRLTVLHIKAIARVYGEDATLMLESLKRIPRPPFQ